jgi:hypothetical protein
MYSGLKDTTGGLEKVKKRLTEVLPKVWNSIEPEFFESLWRSTQCALSGVCSKRMVHQVLGHTRSCNFTYNFSTMYS